MVETSDGARLWTARGGRPDAPPVVFAHGGPGLWDYLDPFAALAADLASVHRYDQRGCGRSGPNGDHRMARYVADLDELRAHFGHERWYVAGHSFGAMLALDHAATHPDRVAGVLYCSGVGLGWPAHRAAHRERAATRLTAPQRTRLSELGARDRSPAEEVEWRRRPAPGRRGEGAGRGPAAGRADAARRRRPPPVARAAGRGAGGRAGTRPGRLRAHG